MTILAVSDIHGSYTRVADILSQEPVFDLLVIAGDLTTNGSPREAEDALKLFHQFGKPIITVAGNMDPVTLEPTFEFMSSYVNGRGVLIDEVGFFGVSGSPFTPMNTPYELAEEIIQERAESCWKDVESARWKIFIPHAPPHDTLVDKISSGAHVGSLAVRMFIERRRPDLVLCGHIHEARGVDTIGETRVVNCGPAGRGYYVIIDLDTDLRVELRG
ncbi:MAG: metallophosphoesterase [Bacteroidota bacterium]